MNSKDYWAKRSALDMARYMRTAEQTAALMEQTGKAAADYINSLIKGVFTGFEGFGISETEARNILAAGNDRTALQRLRAAAGSVTDPEKRQALTNAINSAGAYRYRIDRLEEVSRQITSQCNSLYKTQLSAVTSCLGGAASEAYYRSIFNIQKQTGLGFSFALFPKSQVEQLLSKHWCGASYSQRLWKDTDILADRLKDELLIGLLSGRSGEKTARIIREQFGNNSYCARRLVRTESAYVCNAAALSGYAEAGIERYIFVATLDQKTSEVCAELDGQSFLRSEAKAGTNLPPMHPFCRSTTIADFGENTLKDLERRARDKDGNAVTVPADMTYKQWREMFVDGNKVLTNSSEDGIIKAGSDKVTTGVIEKEQEYGVPYGEDALKADMQYISSEEYAAKFNSVTDNPVVNNALLECSRKAIAHRSGTLYEDMYLINGKTGEILGAQINSDCEQGVFYNESLKNAISKAQAENIPVIAFHSHPEGYPPSIDDFNSAYKNGYSLGVVAGHNGQVYVYNNVLGFVEGADSIHSSIATAFSYGYDIDRAYSEAYEAIGLSYKILKG